MSATLTVDGMMTTTPASTMTPAPPTHATPAPEAATEVSAPTEAQLKAAAERDALTQAAARRRRERLAAFVQQVVPGIVGILLFLLLWQGVAQLVGNFPGPAKVWDSAVRLFSEATAPIVCPWLEASAAFDTRLWIAACAPPAIRLPTTMITNSIQPSLAAPKPK